MATAIVEKQDLGKMTANNASIHHDLEERYFAAQRTGFGHGPSRRYAEAWHDSFDLMTDREDEVILRIDGPRIGPLFGRMSSGIQRDCVSRWVTGQAWSRSRNTSPSQGLCRRRSGTLSSPAGSSSLACLC
jgi:hypothetical protein